MSRRYSERRQQAFSPFLPFHYGPLSSSVQAEIDALSADLGLELRSKSHLPFYGALDCTRIVRDLAPGLSVCFDFKLDSVKTTLCVGLCARLSERNHHRTKFPAYVYSPCDNIEVLSIDWD